MVFILRSNVTENQTDKFVRDIEAKGFKAFVKKGTEHTAVCLLGNTKALDMEAIVETTDFIEYGKRITEQYKTVSRHFHQGDMTIQGNGYSIGKDTFSVIAGPCSIESEQQMVSIAKSVKAAGATLLRGGAFKPRTSPYSFQGLGKDGLKMLITAKKETGLPIVTEIMNQTQVEFFEDVDVIQIGARNMQNYDLLKEVGRLKKPILLKRGLSSTIEELLLSAEYIMSEGNERIILCERGIRTFETATRNTLDISAVVALKQKSYLPVIIDPSHATGIRSYVAPLSKATLAVGADGLMIEVHNDPQNALCDGAQSLDLNQFDDLMMDLKNRAVLENRTI